MKKDYGRIPEYMHAPIERYIEQGILPGSFLQAIVENDLKTACACADATNRNLLWDYCQFFYNFAPSSCWGSKYNVAEWVAAHNATRLHDAIDLLHAASNQLTSANLKDNEIDDFLKEVKK